jgi:DNA-directed RNA polymerase subunit omega
VANLPLEEIERIVGSRYALTVLAGKRAKELREGAPRLVNTDSSNAIIIALQEILEGKITPEYLDSGKVATAAEERPVEPALSVGYESAEGSESRAVELAEELGLADAAAQVPVEPGESGGEEDAAALSAPEAGDGAIPEEGDEEYDDDDDEEDEGEDEEEEGIPQEEI